MSEQTIAPGNRQSFTYDDIRHRMNGEPFDMCLVEHAEIAAIVAAVNVGIDPHLEVCFVPDRGDICDVDVTEIGEHRIEKQHFVFSEESLPVLLRRLLEDSSDEHWEGAHSIASSILAVLGIEIL